jgi:AcrR family transcriptional regulator
MAAGTVDRGMTRRAEYAETTRRAIIDAARRLFYAQGFFATRIDDIAAAARVSPATVYAVFGSKQELLRTVIEIWTRAPIINTTLESVAAQNDAVALIALLARSCRLMREEFGDIVRLLLRTAPHDQAAGEILHTATAQYRDSLLPFARRLAELGALKAQVTDRRAVDILWFYFGYSGLFTLVDENGWSYARAEKWLAEEAGHALNGLSS